MASPEEARELADQIQGTVAQAAQMGRMVGSMPASLTRLIEDLLHPPVPWQELLRPYMHSLVADDESWQRRNRRFQQVYLPARHSEAMGTVVIIGDTSGSIGNDELKQIGGSVVDIAEEVHPEKIHVLWADTRVAGEQEFDRGDHIALIPQGGGGTDMRVPLARAEELDPAVVVLITDCYTPWPSEEPPYPLIVLSSTKQSAPIGEVIHI